MAPNIESGLEVREDAGRLPEPYHAENHKEAYSNGPPLGGGGQYYDQPPNSKYNGQDIRSSPDDHGTRPLQWVCGLTPAFFGFLVALITALIVGAAVGGGLGSALADAKKNNSNFTQTTVTVTTTLPAPTASTTADGKLLNYTAPAPSAVYSVPYPCPSVDGNTYTTLNGQTWAVSCSVDEYTGDIGAVLAYSYEDCIQACAAMNTWQHVNACTRMQFSALMANKTADGFGNCWLKNDTAYTTQPAAEGDLSAKLVS